MPDAIQAFVQQLSTDPSIPVKDTTAWTLGKIASAHPDFIKPALHIVINVLGQSLQLDPKIANSATWALHNIVCIFDDDEESVSSPISKYFFDLYNALLATADRYVV
jgi:importin subunit beta-1